MTDDELLFVGQKAVINRNDEVLILREPTIGLDLPGGKFQRNDGTYIDSLQREVREETGLEIAVGEPFYISVEPIRNPQFRQKLLYLVYFRCRYVSGELSLSDEHTASRWINKMTFSRYNNNSDRYQAIAFYFAKYL